MGEVRCSTEGPHAHEAFLTGMVPSHNHEQHVQAQYGDSGGMWWSSAV